MGKDETVKKWLHFVMQFDIQRVDILPYPTIPWPHVAQHGASSFYPQAHWEFVRSEITQKERGNE